MSKKSKAGVLILVAGWLALVLCAPRAEAAAKQMQITFGGYANRSEVLTNFPVLVVLSNNVGQNFTFADFVTTNGYDLRFATNSASTNWLNHEIESWNTNAGQSSYVWVQVPLIPTNGQGAIWANWGDSAATNRLACTTNGAVWTNGFAGVWHLPDASNSTARDSTSNRYDGTVTSVTATDGMVDGAGGFNGSSSRIVIGDKDVFSSNVLTLDAWIKPNSGSLSGLKTMLSKRGTDEYIFLLNGGKAAVAVWQGGADILTGNTGLSAGQLYHVVGVISASSISIYLNGTSDCTPLSRTKTIQNTTDPVIIGWDNVDSARYFDGVLDEVRISTVARSSNWVWACYLNQASNTVFNNYGAMNAQSGSDSPAVRNDPVTAVTTNSATFNGALSATGGSACAVCVYWGTDTNAWANTNWFNNGLPNAAWTNNTPFSTNIIGLSPMTTYYYTYGASNTTTNVVASGPVSVMAIDLPSVTNLGAMLVDGSSALLRGRVTDTGGETPQVWFQYWLAGDATTNAIDGGVQSGSFSNSATSLLAGSNYVYQIVVSNSAGITVSGVQTFTTGNSSCWYVAKWGSDTNAGTSWAAPFATIGNGVAHAANGQTVYVYDGTYNITNGIVISGVTNGMALTNGIALQSVNGPGVTIVDAGGVSSRRVLYMTNAAAVVSGFTLQRGYPVAHQFGGCVWMSAGLLTNCVVARGYTMNGGGAGVYLSGGVVSHCVIANNYCDDGVASGRYNIGGAGVFMAGGLLENSLIVSNSATGCGEAGAPAHTGAGVNVTNGLVRNCLIRGNVIRSEAGYNPYGAGVGVSGSGVILNCTIVQNNALPPTFARAGGLSSSGAAGGAVTNCIIYGNTCAPLSSIQDIDEPGIAYFSCSPDLTTGVNGNTAAGPDFVDSAGGNFRLTGASPCRNTGTNAANVGAVDLDDAARILLSDGVGIVDRGAYEVGAVTGLQPDFVAAPTAGLAPLQTVFTATVLGDTNGLHCWWDLNNDGTAETNGAGLIVVTNSYAFPGLYSVNLTVSNETGTVTNKLRSGYIASVPLVMHVATNGGAQFPYETWGKAATNLADALAYQQNGGTVLVSNGTHTIAAELTLSKGITVRGFNGASNTTVRRTGSNRYRLFSLTHSNAVLDGLTLINGYPVDATSGGCVWMNGGLVTNCVVSGGTTVGAGAGGGGGGVYMSGGVVSHCVISNNASTGASSGRYSMGGGGVFMAGGLVENSLIVSNSSGGSSSDGQGPAHAGGGMNVIGGTVQTCLIRGNTVLSTAYNPYGAGVGVSGSGVILNCTIVQNSALPTTGARAGGVSSSGMPGGAVTNCIIYGNTCPTPASIQDIDEPGIAYFSCSPDLTNAANQNITADPRFKNAALGDYRLTSDSPCHNTGVVQSWMTAATDLDDSPRRLGNSVDMGCYQSASGRGTVFQIR